MTQIQAERARAQMVAPKHVSLYVATPYCLPTDPDRCGFCLFPSEVFTGQAELETYLRYLQREGEMYRSWFAQSQLGSIYFGGGTANLYRADVYPKLLDIVRDVFGQIPGNIEVTLEGIPQLFNRPKLERMKAAGFNRISMGVQQLQDDMIKLSGRKQTAKQVFQNLDICNELGLATSVDLIFGWPGQTVERMLDDLRQVVGAGVQHITHYELNVAGRSDFAMNHAATLPSSAQNLEMYKASREYLRAQGYHQDTVYDWAKTATEEEAIGAGRYVYEEQMRGFLTPDAERGAHGYETWGWGFAGCSYFVGTPSSPGWAIMNATRIDEYYAHLDAGRFPIERAYQYELPDLMLNWIFQRMQSCWLDGREFASLFGASLHDEFATVWQAFERRGWLEQDEHGIRLVGDGPFYVPLLQTLIAMDRVVDIRKQQAEMFVPPAPVTPRRLPTVA